MHFNSLPLKTLRSIESIALEVEREATSDQTPVVRLLHDGRRVGRPVEGAVLEAQFALDDGEHQGRRFVLLLTHDCPFEEHLSIYLFDAVFRLLDRVEVGHIYTPGIVANVAADRQAIEFDFIHEQRCRVQVHDRPRWRRRLFAPPGISQPGGLLRKHWLEVELLERA